MENRFTIEKTNETYYIKDNKLNTKIKTGKHKLSTEDVCRKLNSYNDKNTTLQLTRNLYTHREFKKLQKENEYLKETINDLIEQVTVAQEGLYKHSQDIEYDEKLKKWKLIDVILD